MKAWLLKLIGGWLPIGTKPFPEWLGKILWAVGIFIACQFLLSYIAPKPIQNIQTQIVGDQRDMMGIGCNFFRLYLKGGVKSQ